MNDNLRKLDIEELKELLKDDFVGHRNEVGSITDFEKQLVPLLDRTKIFEKDFPKKGEGFEVVQFKAGSIVGAVNS